MIYTDVFGSDTLPPSGLGYKAYEFLTDTQLEWAYNTDSGLVVANIMDIGCASGVAITLPDARQVSTGEDFLVRNTGSFALVVKDSLGVEAASVAPGAAVYFYLTDNTSEGGVFAVVAFGVGSSSVDAAALVGYGLKAIGGTLNQAHSVIETSSDLTVSASHRAKLVVCTGGATTLSLPDVGLTGDDYFFLLRNSGSGTVTINPDSSQLIDGQLALTVQPGESLIVLCSGATWYSVGYGRSVLFQFTQLTKDVSAGGTITLTAVEASNKLLTFIGSPSADLTVVVPAVVSIYYVNTPLSTAYTINIKTPSGVGSIVPQGARAVLLCDGTDVVSAQTALASTLVSLVDGAATTPSLNFASQTNTGLYKEGSGVGISVLGVKRVTFSNTLTQFEDITNLKVPVRLRDGTTINNVSLVKE